MRPTARRRAFKRPDHDGVSGRPALNDFEVVVGITQLPAALARAEGARGLPCPRGGRPTTRNTRTFMDRAFVEQHAVELGRRPAVFGMSCRGRDLCGGHQHQAHGGTWRSAARVQPDHPNFPSQEFQLRGNEVFPDAGFTGAHDPELSAATGGAYKKIVSPSPSTTTLLGCKPPCRPGWSRIADPDQRGRTSPSRPFATQ